MNTWNKFILVPEKLYNAYKINVNQNNQKNVIPMSEWLFSWITVYLDY